MIGRWMRRVAVSGAVGAAVWFLVKALRGEPLPAYESGGPSAPPNEPSLHSVPSPAAPAPAPATPAPVPEAEPTPEPASRPTPASTPETPAPAPAADQPWVAAVADEPGPASHPVKAKLKSGIYHLPGMLNYDRTVPDRWYTTAEAAEADQLRRAKR